MEDKWNNEKTLVQTKLEQTNDKLVNLQKHVDQMEPKDEDLE